MIGLFCRILSLSKGSFAKVVYDFKEPTNQSHPIVSFAYLYTNVHFVSQNRLRKNKGKKKTQKVESTQCVHGYSVVVCYT